MDEREITEEYPVAPKDDPRYLIYAQMERVAEARSRGEYALEALEVIEAYLTPYKDAEFHQAYQDMDGQHTFVPRLRACVLLLFKMGLWPPKPRMIRRGEELLQGI